LKRIKALTLALIYSAITVLISLYILGSIDDPIATDNLLYFSAIIIFILPLVVFVLAFNYFNSKISKDEE